MNDPLHFVLALVAALLIVAAAHFAVLMKLRGKPEHANVKNLRAKLFVFDVLLALVVIAVVQLGAHAIFHTDPPPTVDSLMARMEVPETVTVHDMKDLICEGFQARFPGVYGIDLEQDEAEHFAKLLDGVDGSFELAPYLKRVIQGECVRRRVPEDVFVQQVMLIRDPSEKDQMRSEWVAAAESTLLDSAEYHEQTEPAYRAFYDWWTARHPEYAGLTAPVSVNAAHEALVEQIAVSLRRELLVQTAKQMRTTFVTDLRKRGVVISEAKLKQAFLLFLELSKERYTHETLMKTANAIVEEAGLTDEEILHCLILKTRPISDERLATIQDVQVRYLTPLTLEQVPEESVSAVRRKLQELSGVSYGQ